jgi:glycosyltransferase involved in cell wall biosynthesis
MIVETKRTNDSALKVLCFTATTTGPSDRYRIRQLLPHLRKHRIYLEDECLHEKESLSLKLAKLGISPRHVAPLYAIGLARDIQKRLRSLTKQRRFDLVWIQRNILPAAEWLIKLVRKPMILDIDDAVWLGGAFAASRYRFLARRVDEIIVGNQSLHAWFTHYNQHISTIPTSVDVTRFSQSSNRNTGTFRIGWLGTWGNLEYVKDIAGPLRTFLESERGVELVIISDKLPNSLLENIPQRKVKFVQWTENIEFRIADEFDIGIMPLPDSEWTRGKCAFKLLQYLAAGIPAVASPVGLNAEVLKASGGGIAAVDADQWYSAFSALREHEELRRAYGCKGRTFIEQHYSAQRIAGVVAKVMRSVVLRSDCSIP